MAEENKDIVDGLSKVTAKLEEVKNVVETSGRAEAEQTNILFDQQKEAESFNKKLIDMNAEDRRASLDKISEENQEDSKRQKTYFLKLGQFLGKKLDFLQEKGGAAVTETKEKARRLGQKTLTYLQSIAKGISGMTKKAKDAIKSKLPSMSTLLMMGAAGAILALMNSPAMAALKKFLMEDVIPVIADLWEKTLKPALKATVKYFKEIWPDLKKGILKLVKLGKDFYKEHIHPILVAWKDKFIIFFEDFKRFLKDPSWKSFGDLLGENKVVVGTIVTLLALKTFGISGLLTALTGVSKGLKAGAIALKAKGVTNFMAQSGLGPAMLLGGLVLAITDGIAAWHKSKDWGVSGVSAALGGMIAGVDKGLKGAMWGGMKWALIGAGIGSFIPVVGTLIGGAIGALFGAVIGYFGGEKIAKVIDPVVKYVEDLWKDLMKFFKDIIASPIKTIKKLLFGGDDEEKKEFEVEDERKEMNAGERRRAGAKRALRMVVGQAEEGEDESGTEAFDLSTAFFGEEQRKKLARMKALEVIKKQGEGFDPKQQEELKQLRIAVELAKKETASVPPTIINDVKSSNVDASSHATMYQTALTNPSVVEYMLRSAMV